MTRTTEHNGSTYVSVTSAMRLVKTILNEPEDYFGPLGKIHAAEGEGAHRICLDWLASSHFGMPAVEQPPKPDIHPDQVRWDAVLQSCLIRFQEFVKDYKVEPIGLEQEDFSRLYGLVGHIDLPAYFTIPGRRRMKGPIDLKYTTAILESHKLQVRCYGKLDGMKGSQLGGIFWCPRDKDVWKFEPVNLNENLDDFKAVWSAGWLWSWGERKKGA